MADKPLKEGQLHIKQNKFGKKWKRCYVVLYPDSQFGVARLEIYDWKDGTLAGEKIYARRATDRKVVRLAECIHVAPAPTENGHKENMAAFIIETSDKTMLLSAERPKCEEWVQRLSEVAFLGKVNDSQDKGSEASDGSPTLEMAVNSLYVSREEVSEYRVTVQRTEAAERCSLRGTYLLRAESDCLILKDANTKDALYSWPYKLLRRYGRDKVMFSFEAGRRCQSGPGNFTFETSQGHEIFQKVEGSIRAQQGSENRLSCPNLDTDTPSDNTSLGSDSGSEVQTRKEVDERSLKGRALPNLPLAKPETLALGVIPVKSHPSPRSPVTRSMSHSGDPEHLMVYSEPKDSVKGVGPRFDPLYSDPVDSVAGKDVGSHKERSAASPLYSDLYEHVGYEVVGGGVSVLPVAPPKCLRGCEEHIYDEPEGIAQSSATPQLYSEVKSEATAWKRQANDEKVSYEFPHNPNTDDYAMPQFPGKRGNKTGPKPIPAPKPQGKPLPRPPVREDGSEKVSLPPHVVQTNNNNNNGDPEPVYSQVLKTGTVETKEAKPKSTPPLPPKPPSTPPIPRMSKPQPETPAHKPQPETLAHEPQPGAPAHKPQPGAPTPKPQPGTPTPKPQPGTPTPKPQPGTLGHKPQPGTLGHKPQPGTPGQKPPPGTPAAKPQPGTTTIAQSSVTPQHVDNMRVPASVLGMVQPLDMSVDLIYEDMGIL